MTYKLSVESFLEWDDSEYSKEYLGEFEKDDVEKLTLLVNDYWVAINEDVMTPAIVEGILDSIKNNQDQFVIDEFDSLVNFESCRRTFTFNFDRV